MTIFFFPYRFSSLQSPLLSFQLGLTSISVRMCYNSRGIFIMYAQMAIFSMDMLFSLKSCFLGPCWKALEWKMQWIIYWSDWVRYVAVVYFKTVENSVQWIAAFWCDFLLIVAFQSLRSKIESKYWSGCWTVFLLADMAWALYALKLAQGLGNALVLSGLVQVSIQLCYSWGRGRTARKANCGESKLRETSSELGMFLWTPQWEGHLGGHAGEDSIYHLPGRNSTGGALIQSLLLLKMPLPKL